MLNKKEVLFMKNLKDKLIMTLGVVGIILWYLIEIVVGITPLVFLNFPIWVNLIILFALMSMQFIGGLIEIVIWVWSFIVVIARPVDGWSVFYYITFAFYFYIHILPMVIKIIANIIEGIKNSKN